MLDTDPRACGHVVPLRGPTGIASDRPETMPDTNESKRVQGQSPGREHREHRMSTKQTNILVKAAANLQKAAGDAPKAVADRAQRSQSDVADRRKRAQVNEEVLRLRLR